MLLRGLSMGSRFILIIGLTKLLAPSELGEYGLLFATLMLSVSILGGEFHSYSMREVNARPSSERAFVVKNQMLAQSILLIALFPLVLLVFLFDFISSQYIFWFAGLLILELINQEVQYFLVSIHKQIVSSLILFFRFGPWVYIVLPLMYLNPEMNNIHTVLCAWTIGSGLAVIVGGIAVWRSVPVWGRILVDRDWITRGLKTGAYFLLAALSFRGLFTLDRYALEILGSPEELGVYVFYVGVVVGIINLLEPAVFSFMYPRMIQAYHQKQKKTYLKLFRELSISTVIMSFSLSALLWFSMPFLIHWIDKPIYAEHYDSLAVLIGVGVVYALGMIPHYWLYAVRKDRWIIGAQVSSIFFYLIFVWFYQGGAPVMTVALGMLVAFSLMALIKTTAYMMFRRNAFP